ncbi:MAG: diacylglycerol kinase [Flavobacteriales bacterium]|jgi:diacylglycerol kinase (ATP)|tara:strand:+ start:11895 stop:12254 length:360 start_codon:yes stop_codon:yes gene_type:complete
MIKFISGRTKAIYYSIKGAFYLIKTEHSIQTQLFIALLFVIVGCYLDLSNTEWLFVLLAISLVLTAESLNSAIEKVADFIHPDYNKKIGLIKDVSAGAVFFAALFALAVMCLVYIPKLY